LIPFQVNPDNTLSPNRPGIKRRRRADLKIGMAPAGSGQPYPLARAVGRQARKAVDSKQASTPKWQSHHTEQHVDPASAAGHDPPGIRGARLEIRR
jgi:hypothetical protein